MIFSEKNKKAIKQYRQSIFSYANEYKQILLFILLLFFLFLALWMSNRFMYWLFNLGSIGLLYYLILCTFWFAILYAYFVLVRKAAWLEKHQGFIVVLGVLISIILFFYQQNLVAKDLFFKQAVSLVEENNRNSEHLKSVEKDIINDKYVLFWRNFSTDGYKEYWNYIHLNYSQDCKNLYADLTIRFDCLNNMIQTRNGLLIKPGFIQMDIESLNKDIIEGASSTKPILNKIISECQQ